MKTKEEILKEHANETDHWADQEYSENEILQAMQEYAEEYHREKMESVTDEEIYNYIRQRRHEALYPQEGNMSINRITLSEMEWINICLELAKAFRDGRIKS
jgi:hypothetical protein